MNQESEFEQLLALQQKSHSLRQKREESEEISHSLQRIVAILPNGGVSSPS